MPTPSTWPECARSACGGVAVKDGRCLGHLGSDLEQVVRGLTEAGEPLDLRGCSVEAIQPVFAALPLRNEVPFCHGLHASHLRNLREIPLRIAYSGGAPSLPITIDGPLDLSFSQLAEVDLGEVTVAGDVTLNHLRCTSLDAHGVSCRGTMAGELLRVENDLDLSMASLGDIKLSYLSVGGASQFFVARIGSAEVNGTFAGVVNFHNCTVEGNLDLSGSRFKDRLSLNSATINGDVDLRGGGELQALDMRSAEVRGDLLIPTLTFSGPVELARLKVAGVFYMSSSIFQTDVWFTEAAIGDLDAAGVRLLGQTDFGGARIAGSTAVLKDLRAESRLDLALHSKAVDLSGAHFRDGLDLRLGDSVVCLDGTRFDAASLISGPALQHAAVVSMRRARLRNLSLAHLDLSSCLLEEAVGLDLLQLGDGVTFPRAPRAGGNRRKTPGRQVIADEIRWRQAHGHSAWKALPPPHQAHASLRQRRPGQLGAAEIEELYRSLRIARERSGNAPGAADFYYGEMEMRRLRSWSDGGAEKSIVWLYWALSGYGLRASRSLLAIGVLWGLGAFFFLHLGGFVRSASLGETAVFTAASGLAFLHEPPSNIVVTTGGEAAQLVLRIGTAILLAMATLALRGRVKRW